MLQALGSTTTGLERWRPRAPNSPTGRKALLREEESQALTYQLQSWGFSWEPCPLPRTEPPGTEDVSRKDVKLPTTESKGIWTVRSPLHWEAGSHSPSAATVSPLGYHQPFELETADVGMPSFHRELDRPRRERGGKICLKAYKQETRGLSGKKIRRPDLQLPFSVVIT